MLHVHEELALETTAEGLLSGSVLQLRREKAALAASWLRGRVDGQRRTEGSCVLARLPRRT